MPTKRNTSSRKGPARGGARRRSKVWRELPDAELLEWRICDLDLRIKGTPLEARLARLGGELEGRGLRFRPYAWLSTDWFTPDGANGFAIPFFLADRRLQRLEHKQMLEVEGGSTEWCMKILRHETAHTIDNAYRLHWKKRWREVFGKFSQRYEASYTPDPTSRDFVVNLPYWYSQSHPAEDWAETFAVWLRPGARWRSRYADWPAIRKLEFVDELMQEIGSCAPTSRSRTKDEPIRTVKTTLREYYDRKQHLYIDDASPAFDGQLHRLFQPDENGTRDNETAVAFFRRHRRKLVRHVSSTTGQNAYLVDHVVGEMARRGKSMRLRMKHTEDDTLLDSAVLLTSLTMQFLHGGHPNYQR